MNKTADNNLRISVEEDEISLLDMLIVVAENLKLLILGPVVAVLLVLGYSLTIPQSFTSEAILVLPTPTPTPMPTPTQAAAMMISPTVLDPVITSLNLSRGRSHQVTRTRLANQIKVTVGKDGLLYLYVTANTALDAQTVATAVIDTWLKSTVPGEQDRADLEKRLNYAKISLEAANRLPDRIVAEGVLNPSKSRPQGQVGTPIAMLVELQARYMDEILSIQRLLQGLSHDVVKQSPTLPTDPVASSQSRAAVMAALTTGFALLLWVFLRHAWKNAAQAPELAEKQAKLRAALGFKVKGAGE